MKVMLISKTIKYESEVNKLFGFRSHYSINAGINSPFKNQLKNKKNYQDIQTTCQAILSEKQKLESNLEKLNSDYSALRQRSDENTKLSFNNSLLKLRYMRPITF